MFALGIAIFWFIGVCWWVGVWVVCIYVLGEWLGFVGALAAWLYTSLYDEVTIYVYMEILQNNHLVSSTWILNI